MSAIKDKDPNYEFGVPEMADYLGIAEASVRIKLRNGNVKKNADGRYGWKTKKEMQEVADGLGAKAAKAAPAKSKSKEKPAPAAKAKAAKTGKAAAKTGKPSKKAA